MLRDDERDALAHMAMEDDGPDQVDPDLLTAIRELTSAVKAIKTPTIPPFDVKPVVTALSGMTDAGEQIAALRQDVQSLSRAVSSIDVSAIADAIKGLQRTQELWTQALRQPKEIVFDGAGNPTGVRIAKMN